MHIEVANAAENVEGITEIAEITLKMFEAVGVGIGITAVGIVGVVNEMSSRGGEASGAAASGPKGSAGRGRGYP